MIDLLQITNDPVFARRCDALDGMRLWVDLERLGKAERQAGRNTFISVHTMEDVGRIKSVLRRSPLMVRVNPLNPASAAEVDDALAQGADWLMLPMFSTATEVAEFSRLVDRRVPVTPLLETAQALECLDDWVGTPGLVEVFVGLNDLHLSLGCAFMFEPLAMGLVDRAAAIVHARGLRFGFGGIARLEQGHLPGRDVLAEHVRLGSRAVILSRTFHGAAGDTPFEQEIGTLRATEAALARRTAPQQQSDRARIAAAIQSIADSMAGAGRPGAVP
ncbi:MAG: aldolase [Ramlibacter sp.]|jgi:hypothetical protein|nr:aldolase [Ramlibacter sp.]